MNVELQWTAEDFATKSPDGSYKQALYETDPEKSKEAHRVAHELLENNMALSGLDTMYMTIFVLLRGDEKEFTKFANLRFDSSTMYRLDERIKYLQDFKSLHPELFNQTTL